MTHLVPMQMLSAVNKANLEAMRVMTTSMFNAAERVAALNLDATRSAIEYAAHSAGRFQGGNWTDGTQHAEADLKPVAEKTAAYFRAVQDVSAEVQGEITQILASRASETTDAMISLLDNLEKAAPAGAVPGVAIAKSVIANAHSAYDTLLSNSKQVAEANAAAVAKATSAISAAGSAAKVKKAA